LAAPTAVRAAAGLPAGLPAGTPAAVTPGGRIVLSAPTRRGTQGVQRPPSSPVAGNRPVSQTVVLRPVVTAPAPTLRGATTPAPGPQRLTGTLPFTGLSLLLAVLAGLGLALCGRRLRGAVAHA
jgi:hypothetical protein